MRSASSKKKIYICDLLPPRRELSTDDRDVLGTDDSVHVILSVYLFWKIYKCTLWSFKIQNKKPLVKKIYIYRRTPQHLLFLSISNL